MKQYHDIKYDARQQLSYFFSHLGLLSDEFLDYMFLHIPEKLNREKKLIYDLRYNFGERGARNTDPMWTCSKVCQAEIHVNNPLKFHGCPFNTLKKEILEKQLFDLLQQYLLEWKVNEIDIFSFVDKIKRSIRFNKSNTQMCTELLKYLCKLQQWEQNTNDDCHNENSCDIEDIDDIIISIDKDISFPNEFTCTLNQYYHFCNTN